MNEKYWLLWEALTPLLGIWCGLALMSGSASEPAKFMTKPLVGWFFHRLRIWQCRNIGKTRLSASTGYTGYKWALLELVRRDSRERLQFRPLRQDNAPYGVESVAVCSKYEMHRPPVLHHDATVGCGFHALKLARHLGKVEGSAKRLRHPLSKGVVLLEVEMYGNVQVGALGYRASKQRVMKISLPSR